MRPRSSSCAPTAGAPGLGTGPAFVHATATASYDSRDGRAIDDGRLLRGKPAQLQRHGRRGELRPPRRARPSPLPGARSADRFRPCTSRVHVRRWCRRALLSPSVGRQRLVASRLRLPAVSRPAHGARDTEGRWLDREWTSGATRSAWRWRLSMTSAEAGEPGRSLRRPRGRLRHRCARALAQHHAGSRGHGEGERGVAGRLRRGRALLV